MNTRLRWGILGTGNIARQFAAGASKSDRSELVAVGSRSDQSARGFASAYGIARACGSYEQVLADREVDAVYISLPNTLHHEWTLKALAAGKHVLCEKPLAANAAEATEMFDAAQKAGRILVEAFMYRGHPQTLAILEAVRSGAIGTVRLIRSSFCYFTTKIAGNIRFQPELAGGSLMDVGCYCLDFSRLIAGEEPAAASATAHIHETGVDDFAAGVLTFPGGIVASFTCGMRVQADNAAYICGDDGFIEIPIPWKPPVQNATYTIAHSTPPRMDTQGTVAPRPPRQSFSVNAELDLYGIEANDFALTVLDARPPRVTRAQSLGNMRLLDQLRRQIGLSY